MAHRAFLSKPDLVVVPGDIVYEHGLVSEYDTTFWPIYNADKASKAGAPLMCSIPFVHWDVLDSNHYMDLTDNELNEWIAKDLTSAKNATWRFVMFHHPGFNSAQEHFEQ